MEDLNFIWHESSIDIEVSRSKIEYVSVFSSWYRKSNCRVIIVAIAITIIESLLIFNWCYLTFINAINNNRLLENESLEDFISNLLFTNEMFLSRGNRKLFLWNYFIHWSMMIVGRILFSYHGIINRVFFLCTFITIEYVIEILPSLFVFILNHLRS